MQHARFVGGASSASRSCAASGETLVDNLDTALEEQLLSPSRAATAAAPLRRPTKGAVSAARPGTSSAGRRPRGAPRVAGLAPKSAAADYAAAAQQQLPRRSAPKTAYASATELFSSHATATLWRLGGTGLLTGHEPVAGALRPSTAPSVAAQRRAAQAQAAGGGADLRLSAVEVPPDAANTCSAPPPVPAGLARKAEHSASVRAALRAAADPSADPSDRERALAAAAGELARTLHGPGSTTGGRSAAEAAALRRKVATLEATVGRLAVANEALRTAGQRASAAVADAEARAVTAEANASTILARGRRRSSVQDGNHAAIAAAAAAAATAASDAATANTAAAAAAEGSRLTAELRERHAAAQKRLTLCGRQITDMLVGIAEGEEIEAEPESPAGSQVSLGVHASDGSSSPRFGRARSPGSASVSPRLRAPAPPAPARRRFSVFHHGAAAPSVGVADAATLDELTAEMGRLRKVLAAAQMDMDAYETGMQKVEVQAATAAAAAASLQAKLTAARHGDGNATPRPAPLTASMRERLGAGGSAVLSEVAMALRGQSEGIVERVVTVLLASQGGDVLLRSQFWPLFGALASFMDSDLDEVLEALESALRGEPTALRELLAAGAEETRADEAQAAAEKQQAEEAEADIEAGNEDEEKRPGAVELAELCVEALTKGCGAMPLAEFLLAGPAGAKLQRVHFGALRGASVHAAAVRGALVDASQSTARRLSDAQQRAEAAEAEVARLREENDVARTELARLGEVERYALEARRRLQAEQKARERTSKLSGWLAELEAEGGDREHFEGLGADDLLIPEVLRFDGQVRNRRWSKPDTERLARTLLAQKLALNREARAEAAKASAKADAATARRRGAAAQSMGAFVADFARKARRGGGAAGKGAAVADFGYNLVAACKRYEYDADCEVMLRILCGELREEVYEESVRLHEDLGDMFAALDAAQTPDGRMTGTVSKADARLGLRAFFRSDKSDEELAELLRALDRDAPGDSVDYEALLADDDNLDQGEFAELARDQLLAARLRFFDLAERELLFATRFQQACAPADLEAALRAADPQLPHLSIKRCVADVFRGKHAMLVADVARGLRAGAAPEAGERGYAAGDSRSPLAGSLAAVIKARREAALRRKGSTSK